MKLGIKKKVLLALVGVLVLVTGLHAFLASYFTNRQNKESAFATLQQDLIAWQNELNALTLRLREAAIASVSDRLVLDQLDGLISTESQLNDPKLTPDNPQIARTQAYLKAVSLSRLELARRASGFSSIAVYIGGKLSYGLSTSGAGMMVHRRNAKPVWVTASANAKGIVPIQQWPAWPEGQPDPVFSLPTNPTNRATVSFRFLAPEKETIQITVPVEAAFEDSLSHSEEYSPGQYIAHLGIPSGVENSHPGSRASPIVAVIVFHKFIDKSNLEWVANWTGGLPALFSLDGEHGLQMPNHDVFPQTLVEKAHTSLASGRFQDLEQTLITPQGSFCVTLRPWQFEKSEGLIFGLGISRSQTLENIRQTVAAILLVAGVILILGLGLGVFLVGRFMNPILALTAAAKDIGRRTRLAPREVPPGQVPLQELRPITIKAPDEIGDLAQAFNEMLFELRKSVGNLANAFQEMKEMRNQFRLAIDTIPGLVWSSQPDGQVDFLNQRWREFTGLSLEEASGWGWQTAVHPDDLRGFVDYWKAVLSSGIAGETEARLRRHDGQYRWFLFRTLPLRDESGTIVKWFGTNTEIEERKRAEAGLHEAQSQLARVTRLTTVGELAASIAHEVNQPLAGVVTSAQASLNWLANRPPNLLKARESIERVLRDGNRAGEVLARVRALLKKAPVSKSPVALNQVVRDVLLLAGPELRRLGVKVSLDLHSELPAVLADQVQLQQVILNLIMNAIEAMIGNADGTRKLRIHSRPHDFEHQPAVLVAVRDSGVGLTAESMQRLFEAFHTTKSQGLGMGLWISRSIIEAHGGELSAHPNEGPGATFQFLLPAVSDGFT